VNKQDSQYRFIIVY